MVIFQDGGIINSQCESVLDLLIVNVVHARVVYVMSKRAKHQRKNVYLFQIFTQLRCSQQEIDEVNDIECVGKVVVRYALIIPLDCSYESPKFALVDLESSC